MADIRARQHYWGLRYAGRAGVLVFASVFALCIGLQSVLMFAFTPGFFLFATILATLTAVPHSFLLVWLDRNEQEPVWLMTLAFMWGALVATAISGIFNTIFASVATNVVGNEMIGSQLSASFSAPFIEELTKGAALAVIYLLFKNHFDNVLDGILYGALVGMGFAWFENIMYYVNTGAAGGAGEMVKLTWIRGFLNGIGSHAAYTGLTGLGFGLFRVMRKGFLRWLLLPFFWGMAMFVHFLWNTFAILFIIPFAESEVATLLISLPLAVVFLEGPFALFLLLVVLFVWRHENRVIRTYLADERNDVVSPELMSALVPARKRTFNQLKVFFTRGPVKWWHQRQLFHELIRLAFIKWHHAADEVEWHADHDAEILALRDGIRTRRARLA